MKWHQKIAAQISKHSDSLAVMRAPRGKAKHITNRRRRRLQKWELISARKKN